MNYHISHEQKARLIAMALESVHPIVRNWLGETRTKQNLNTDLDLALSWIDDHQFASEFHAAHLIPGSTAQDYLNRMITLPNDRHAIVGIRFKGGRSESPFVDLLSHDFVLTDAQSISDIIMAVEDCFAVFRAKQLRIRRGSHQDVWPLDQLQVHPEMRYVATSVSELKGRERPEHYQALELRKAENTQFYQRYRAVYDELHQASDIMRAEVPFESIESFEEALMRGHVYEVFVEGEWAGVTAAVPHVEYGMDGYCIMEEVLAKRFRGKGLGPVLLRHLIDRLDGSHEEIIFGTIHHMNQPSMATAIRTGLVDVGGFTFVQRH